MPTDFKGVFKKPIVFKLLFVFLVLVILIQLLFESWSLVRLNHIAFDTPDKTIAANDHAHNKKEAFNPLIFGDYVPDDLGDASIKKSMLNLKVVGVIFSENETYSQVMIQSANGKENLYSVGDRLPGGVIIKRITPLGVVVSRNGHLESLTLPKHDLRFDSPPSPLNEE